MDGQATDTPRAFTLQSCLAVLGGSLALFCTVGFLNAFGVFQEYYKSRLLQDMSESDISWIGSVSIFILYILAPVTGVLVDLIGPTILLVSGSVGQLVAIFMTSLCTRYYQFFLAQAVLLGASMAFTTWPSVAVVSRRLPAHRGLALGLVIGGSSLGGVVWPIMLQRLLNESTLGFGWTIRVVGFTMLPLFTVACATVIEPRPIRPAVPSSVPSDGSGSEGLETREKPTKKVDLSIAKNPVFVLLALGLGIGYLGLFVPFFYVSAYAIHQGFDQQISFYLISILNGASIFGRVGPGHLADTYGHFNLIILSLLFSAIIAFCWTAAANLAGLIVWSIAYGFTSGAIVSLQGACVGKIASHHNQGTAMGMLFGAVAVTTLVGTPIAGSLVSQHGYVAVSCFSGATLLAGCLLVLLARLKLSTSLLSAH